MRRSVSIVAGAVAALALAGTAGAVGWTQTSRSESREVGTWHEAPAVAASPTVDLAPPPAESAQVKDDQDGRQQVGEVLRLNKRIGYGRPEREVFSYPQASYVKLHFRSMVLRPGDYLTVSDAAGQESYRYDAPAAVNPTAPSDKWAMSVTGDTAVLEIHRGPGAEVGAAAGTLGVQVDKVAKGFSRSEQAQAPVDRLLRPGLTGREESICGGDQSSDAVCYKSSDPVAYTRSLAIARLLINGTELCTGWRVGAKNRLITNNHCFSSSADAYETEVWFNYQCAKCGGYQVFKPTKVWGDKVISTSHVYDYTLFTVENFASVQKYGYLTLDTARPARNQELYVPQHPAGEPTRIAGRLGDKAGTCAVVDNAFDGYATNSDVSYYCDTEGGSSGSPVLSRRTNKVVALHHFGGCPNSGVRGDLLATKLKSYL
ncbi:serine protease [Actinoplanes sp. TFC3]|uniref:trypsin-like serine peptidase n=1 Tax=Actinoplanes sp. TFC3 TaxID=1710355 RepID=UPI000836251E|nr:serine protease [Actinoplanes sp. TFC3]